MAQSIRKNHRLRMSSFDLLKELKQEGISCEGASELVHNQTGISKSSLHDWYYSKYAPHGRRGYLNITPDLFYVLGALFGDGCIYKYRTTNHYIILAGDYDFATKYANRLSKCIGKKNNPYIDRNKNVWIVRANNHKLFRLFRNLREDIESLSSMLKNSTTSSSMLFLEGFFDAEGCVKIIKDRYRKTPKICLDITNTNYQLLELLRNIMKEKMGIAARYSIQNAYTGKDGHCRKKTYHLRVYKKAFVKIFLDNISTTKLKREKIPYVNNWFGNGKAMPEHPHKCH